MKKLILSTIFSVVIQPLLACTIFILTDGEKALFFNNEDFTNPNNRIWFIPAGANHFGCVFVGYDDGSAQGGMNTEGLAFDWYAGDAVDYQPTAELVPIKDNSSERMLEQCATIEEAIKFYQTYAEPGFAKASIIIADKSGKSVIIGARDGKLFFDKSTQSNVLGGQGKNVFNRLYTENTPISLISGSAILKQCVATGPGGTLYSNSYNLKTGEIHIYDFSEPEKYTTLILKEELDKGGHYYDIAQVGSELNQPLKPLQLNMQRLILFEFQPLENQEPKISSLTEKIFTEGARGQLKAEYFSNAFWSEIQTDLEGIKSELQQLGKLNAQYLIQKEVMDEFVTYDYVMIFENARLLQRINLDNNEKVSNLKTLSAFVTNSKVMTMKSEGSTPGAGNQLGNYILPMSGLIIIGFVIYMTVRRKESNAL